MVSSSSPFDPRLFILCTNSLEIYKKLVNFAKAVDEGDSERFVQSSTAREFWQ